MVLSWESWVGEIWFYCQVKSWIGFFFDRDSPRVSTACPVGHLQSQSELYHVSWYFGTLVNDLFGQLNSFVIGGLSLRAWCHWLWRRWERVVRFDHSFVIGRFIHSCQFLLSLQRSRFKGTGNCWLRFSGVFFLICFHFLTAFNWL